MSAAGDDDIHVEFLRASTANVRRAVYQLNSRCWGFGILPSAYTRAKVMPLYKTAQAGPRDEANSYRPISITTLLFVLTSDYCFRTTRHTYYPVSQLINMGFGQANPLKILSIVW